MNGRFGAGAIVVIAVGVFAAVMLIAGRDGSEPSTTVSAADTHASASAAPAKASVSKVKAPPAAPVASDVTPSSAATISSKSLSATVTVAGCLERDDKTFRLKDTSGADAPKARSWKSGFLKKGSTPLELRDPSTSGHLVDHVGQRVSVTGTLIDRQMIVQSLRRLSESCK